MNNAKGLVIHFSIQGLLISLTILYCILFPADKWNIKELFLIIALLSCSPYIYKAFKKKSNLTLLFYSVIYPAVTTISSITIGDSSLFGALSYGYVWLFLLFIPAIVELDINIKVPFICGTCLIAFMILYIFLSDLFGLISIYSNPVLSFFSKMNEVQWGKGSLATFGYSIFFKSSPLIVFTLGYFLNEKNYYLALLLFLSLIGSGTRANLLVGIFLIVSIPLINKRTEYSNRFFIAIFILGISLLVVPALIDHLIALNQIKYERSEAIKLEAVTSIFKHLNSAPYRYIFGSGVGSFFYSTGRQAYVDVVEVSFFDYFRQVGIVGFSLFIYFLLHPVKWLFENQKWLLMCYMGYLAIAATNPLLVTSTSFIAYIIIFSNGFSSNKLSLLAKYK